MDIVRFAAHIGNIAEADDDDAMLLACLQFWIAYPKFVSIYFVSVVTLFVYAFTK